MKKPHPGEDPWKPCSPAVLSRLASIESERASGRRALTGFATGTLAIIGISLGLGWLLLRADLPNNEIRDFRRDQIHNANLPSPDYVEPVSCREFRREMASFREGNMDEVKIRRFSYHLYCCEHCSNIYSCNSNDDAKNCE